MACPPLLVLVSLPLVLGACGSGAASSSTSTPGTDAPAASAPSVPVSTPALKAPPVQASFSYNIGATDQLNAGATPAGQVVSLDLQNVNAPVIARLKGLGRYVVCYFSAGSSERFRTDAGSVALQQDSLNLGTLEGWPDERWLDIRGFGGATNARLDTIRRVMGERLDLARSKGCDAAEFDNVEAWNNSVNIGVSGLSAHAISAQDQLDYNRWLAREARARGVAALLKNDLGQVPALLADYDGAVNEECYDYDECGALDPFRDAGKAIYVVEYQAAAWVTPERQQTAAVHHLNTTLTDLAVSRLNPLASFGAW